MRTQDRQSSAEAATVQLGCDRQVFRVESLHFRGKKCTGHLQHTQARQDCHYIESITEVEKQACNTLQG